MREPGSRRPEQTEAASHRKDYDASLRRLLACVLIVTAVSTAFADDNEFGSWLIASSADVLPGTDQDGPWRYSVDAQFRWVDDSARFRQYLLRPAIGYTLTSGVQVWLGYGRFETDRRNRPVSHENRYWQQVNWRVGKWRGGVLAARVRLEQRNLSTGDDLAVVSRWMLRYTRPLEGPPDRYWTASLEPFVDFRDTDWGAEKGLSQNRIAIAFGQTVSEHVALEVGYMNQYFFRDSAADCSNHLLTFHAKVTF